MSGPSRRDLARAVESLRDEADASQSRAWVDVPPETARRVERAFAEYGADDPERLAHLFTYGPSGEDEDGGFTDSEAEAVRTVEWRERFGEVPPWEDSGS